jgi:hypothetical protein
LEQFEIYAHKVLAESQQLRSLRHLTNSVALEFDMLPEETRVLLDGCVFELVSSRAIGRIQTVSRTGKAYQTFYSSRARTNVESALKAIRSELDHSRKATVEELARTIRLSTRDLEILFGHALYRGWAIAAPFDGSPIASIVTADAA